MLGVRFVDIIDFLVTRIEPQGPAGGQRASRKVRDPSNTTVECQIHWVCRFLLPRA